MGGSEGTQKPNEIEETQKPSKGNHRERAREGAIPKVSNNSEEGRVQNPQVSSLGREPTEATERQVTPLEREATEATNAQRYTPKVERVTPQNRGRVSEELKGLIVNPNGTLTATPQWKTWTKNIEVQRVNYYNSIPTEFPMTIQREGHAKISNLDLHWTYQGEWAKIPRDRNYRGRRYDSNYDIVRIERYIDEDGNIRKAVCYATQDIDLKVWFRYEDMLLSHPHWQIPSPSIYFNRKKWIADIPPG